MKISLSINRITIGYYYRRVKQIEMMVILHIGIMILILKIIPSAGPLLLPLQVDFRTLDENSCRQPHFLPHLVRFVGEDPSACLHRRRKIGPNGQASVGVAGLSGGFSTSSAALRRPPECYLSHACNKPVL